jgi:hypothetical protein
MTPEQFHKLLDEATGAAPPPPHPGEDLAAGRTRLRRRRTGATGAGLAAAAVIAVAVGSVLTGSPRSADESPGFATEPSSAFTPGTIDPRILRDVIDAAFPTPGDAQLRNIRVHTFLRGWGIERCGGTAAPLDSTADRFDQDLFPSLDLIRERGFTEPTQESFAGARDDCEIGEELQEHAPALQDWFELAGPWHDLSDAVVQNPELVALGRPMAQCLRQATGLEIDDKDPAGSFLGAVDQAGGRSATDHEQMERAAAYADCGKSYFGTLEELLMGQRPTYVERHRELLEEFARQISALGYTP